jgi:RNA polymerase-binding transcription factor DksA
VAIPEDERHEDDRQRSDYWEEPYVWEESPHREEPQMRHVGESPGAIGADDDDPTGSQLRVPSPADDVRSLDDIESDLAGVDAALRRLDEGSYGRCEVCGAQLGADALQANPLATRCADHAP